MAGYLRADVAIVGAGLAGVECARTLQMHSPHLSVVVVEARHEVGGRVRSIPSGDSAVELGAGWIHGDDEDNPLLQLCSEAGMEAKPVVKGNFWMDGSESCGGKRAFEVWHSRGTGKLERVRAEVVDTAESAMARAKAFTREYAHMHRTGEKNVGDALDEFEREWTAKGEEEHAVWQWLKWRYGAWFGLEVDELSLSEWEEPGGYGDYPGRHCSVKMKSGNSEGGHAASFQRAVEERAKTLDVKLGWRVVDVKWSNSGVSLRSAAGEEVKCRRCVVTLPLGVLQRNSSALFTPLLPAEKLKALNRGRMGGYKKTVFFYSSPFWLDALPSYFIAVTSGGSKEESVDHHFGVVENYAAMKGVSAIGVVCVGKAAFSASRIEEDRWKEETQAKLERLFVATGCSQPVPQPVRVEVTNWEEDDLFFGAYSSFDSRCADPEQVIADLAQPVGPLHFAGEAYSLLYQGSLHGAVENAREVAERVAASLRTCDEA